MTTTPAIATLDLREWRRGARERADFGAALASALRQRGFVAISGHGIDEGLIRRVYAEFRAFFTLPEAEKQRCGDGQRGQRGFTGFAVEHAKGCAVPDLKEFFHVGRERAADSACVYPQNIWPDIQGLREDGTALFAALEACAEALLEALAFGLELPADTFASMLRDGNSVLRAAHYPPSPASSDPSALRAAPHEDINLITLLCEATDAGLEIEIEASGERRFVPVSAPAGQIVVDSGDMLSRLTNDAIPSTTHRVTTPRGSERASRYSLPFFAHPRPECELDALPAFVSGDRPARLPPITAGAYLEERLREIGLASQ